MSEQGRWELPSTWAWAMATDFAKVVGGGTPENAKKAENYAVNGIPWITPADLSGYGGAHISRGSRDLSAKGFSSCSARILPKGSVLLSSRAPVGYCVVAANDVCTNQGFKSFVFHGDSVVPEYLRYYLIGSKQYLESEASGTTFLELSGGRAEQLLFPIAPVAEQGRIVSKVDELFSRIEEGERALKRVQKLVEYCRQSVLKAAVTGELTREWRAQREGELEPGEVLLQRVLRARREAWELAELGKMEANGLKPANDNWKGRYQDPLPPDASSLPALPRGWAWASVGQLCFVDTGATPKRGTTKYYEGGTIPWITSAAVNERLVVSAGEFITPEAIYGTNAKVFPCGSLIVALYGEGKTRGKVSELGIDAATNQACAALLCGHFDAQVKTYLRSFFEKHYTALRSEAAGGVQPNLNLSILKSTALPLPPIDEIKEINERLSQRQAQLGAVVAEFPTWGNRATALRQAILREAFRGNLVRQDPTDEPASALLQRVAAGRGAANTAAPKGDRKKKQAA